MWKALDLLFVDSNGVHDKITSYVNDNIKSLRANGNACSIQNRFSALFECFETINTL